MNKNWSRYYAVIIFGLFFCYNIILNNLMVEGILSHFVMILFSFINGFILFHYYKEIHYKVIIGILYFLICFFAKNLFQCLFDFSNIIILCVIDTLEKKKNPIIVSLELCLFLMPIGALYILFLANPLDENYIQKDIIPHSHYSCQNHIEIYQFSNGSLDEYHYSISKHYEFVNMKHLLYVAYHKRQIVSFDDYQNYLDTHACSIM